MASSKAKTGVLTATVLILALGATLVMVYSHQHPRLTPQQMLVAKERFDADTWRLANGAKISAVASFHFADNHQGQWPTSFVQLRAEHPESRLSDSDWEFVSGGNRASFTDPAQTILFRERQPRQSPDGIFVRVYAFADDSIQVLTSEKDDFTRLEKQRGYLTHPATN